jgi:hypothetical protein
MESDSIICHDRLKQATTHFLPSTSYCQSPTEGKVVPRA